MELAARIGTMARRGAPLPYAYETKYNIFGGSLHFNTGVTVGSVNEISCLGYFPSQDEWKSWGEGTGVNHDFISLNSSAHVFNVRYWTNGSTMTVIFRSGTSGGVSFAEVPSSIASILMSISTDEQFVSTKNITAMLGEEIKTGSSYSSTGTASIIIGGYNAFANGLGIGEAYAALDGDKKFHYKSVVDFDGNARMWDVLKGEFVVLEGEGVMTAGPRLEAFSIEGGGTKCLTTRRSYRRSLRPSARFCAHSQEWEVAA